MDIPLVKHHHLQNDDADSSSSSTTETTHPSSGPSDSSSNHHIGIGIGAVMIRRASQFFSVQGLPKNQLRRVSKLNWDDLDVGTLLGTGGFSSVYDVKIRPGASDACICTDKKFAIKFLDSKMWYQGAGHLSHATADLALEAKLLTRLNHPNIIQIHGMTQGCPSKSFDTDKRGFFVILDLLDETLHDRLKQWSETNHDNVLLRLKTTAIGIAKGMEYLHSKNVAFRDLKPRNIGYCASTGEVKIFDFGLAACNTSEEQTRRTMVGTFRYLAPEVMLEQGYGQSCDVYSFGIVLWQIVSLQQKFAYKIRTRAEFVEWVIRRGGRPSLKNLACPKRVNRLIKECWCADPQARPTFKTIRSRLEKVVAISSDPHYS